ncbi:MAG: hypothetical protein VYB26_06525 [Pseudomonadota bacterium]|nr:hypothetical protein [Pseudomonadota bacterium]
MVAAFVILVGLGVYNSDAVSEFRAHSNHNPEYVFAYVEECDSGLRNSGYAFAPSGSIMLKQVNSDGTVGEVCTN